MELKEILEKAKSELAALTGLKPVSVTQAFQDAQGWHVRVEMLEMSRIPPATDVLGDYKVLLTEDGAMLRFERERTRLRGEPVEEQRA
jgi:hypothetical protein